MLSVFVLVHCAKFRDWLQQHHDINYCLLSNSLAVRVNENIQINLNF
jgi:hypothetical protein